MKEAELHELMRRHWRKVMAATRPPPPIDVDLTFPQLRAISAIGRLQPVRVSDLASEIGAGLAATSALVERLARAALVARRADPEDRRTVLLELTPRARRILERIQVGSTERFERLIERMTPAERDALGTVLHAFVRLTEEHTLNKGPHGLVTVERRRC